MPSAMRPSLLCQFWLSRSSRSLCKSLPVSSTRVRQVQVLQVQVLPPLLISSQLPKTTDTCATLTVTVTQMTPTPTWMLPSRQPLAQSVGDTDADTDAQLLRPASGRGPIILLIWILVSRPWALSTSSATTHDMCLRQLPIGEGTLSLLTTGTCSTMTLTVTQMTLTPTWILAEESTARSTPRRRRSRGTQLIGCLYRSSRELPSVVVAPFARCFSVFLTDTFGLCKVVLLCQGLNDQRFFAGQLICLVHL